MSATEESINLTKIAAKAILDKQGTDLVAIDVSEQLAIADVFLIASATNERQVSAIVDAIEEALAKYHIKPASVEGRSDNRWVLLDYLDIVIHIQHVEERTLYALERLWKDCPKIDIELENL